MLYCDFQDYIRAIPILKAQESLEAITVSSYPHSKKEHQQKVHKALHKQANPGIWDAPKKPMTLEQLSKVVSGGR
jgi:hypothetical protein